MTIVSGRRAATAALLSLSTLARAQGAFPQRAVSMIVAFPPGGQADVVARPVAAALERHWRQPVPIVNRPGAAGELGNAAVARAAPDGYTLLMALSSITVLPVAARLRGRVPAYELDQLAPVALFTADPTLLVVAADSPWRTLEEFVAAAKAQPNAIAYSSAGNYSALHVPMAMLAAAARIEMLHVPFQGGGPALTALLGGQVQALASGPGPVAPHLQSGRLRALAGWGAERPPNFAAVPTLRERGYADNEFYIWTGVFAPAATPRDTIELLRAAMAVAAADPDARRALEASGNTVDHRDGAAFRAFYDADGVRLARAVERIGVVE